MFKKGGFWRGLAGALIGAAAGGLGGALIGVAMFVFDYGSENDWWRPTPVDAELAYWTEHVFAVYMKPVVTEIDSMRSLTDANIRRFNEILEEINAFRTYYEFQAQNLSSGSDKELAIAKAESLTELLTVMHDSWLENLGQQTDDYEFVHRTFNAVKYAGLPGELFNWRNVRSVRANKYAYVEKGSVGSFTSTGSGQATPPIEPPVSTGSGFDTQPTQPPVSTGSGFVATAPTPQEPPYIPTPVTPTPTVPDIIYPPTANPLLDDEIGVTNDELIIIDEEETEEISVIPQQYQKYVKPVAITLGLYAIYNILK